MVNLSIARADSLLLAVAHPDQRVPRQGGVGEFSLLSHRHFQSHPQSSALKELSSILSSSLLPPRNKERTWAPA